MSHINLVQNDTGPNIVVQLTNDNDGTPINMVGGTVIMKFRLKGATVLTDTLNGTLLPNFQRPDGTFDLVNYPANGQGGRVSFAWNPTTLALPGVYEGSVQVTNGGLVQNVYQVVDFAVRASF